MRATNWMRNAAVGMAGTAIAVAASTGFPSAAVAADQQSTAVRSPGYTVSMSAAGFGLNVLTIPVGQTLSFLNLDSQPRQVALNRTDGSSCQELPLMVWPQTFRSCTFATPGVYVVTDPTSSSSRATTTITVAPQDDVLSAVTLAAAEPRVLPGSALLLEGTINLARAGVQVDIIAKVSKTGRYTKIGQVSTTATGGFSYLARPDRTTVYLANAILSTTIVTSGLYSVQMLSGAR